MLSGPGLHAIYEFLRDAKRNEPTWLAEKIKAGDPAAEIAEAGLKGQAEIAKQALDLLPLSMAQKRESGAQSHGHQWCLCGGGIAPKLLPNSKTAHS